MATALLGGTIVAASIVTALYGVLFHVLQYYNLRYRYPEFFPLFTHVALKVGFTNLVRSTGFMITNVCGQLVNS